nr:FAD-binding oxidoreductase [Propionibacterium sp.]
MTRVGILGAGIMGSCLALELARRGADVTLIDRNEHVLSETSRFNEGKIHLGYLYGLDATLATARHILPGGLVFADLLSDLLACDVAAQATRHDDVYLVDRESLASPEALAAQFAAVSGLIREHPDAARYLVDVSRAAATPLTRAELDAVASDRIVGGFRVPERSVNTAWVADRLADAVAAEGRVTFLPGVTITAARPDERGGVRVEGLRAEQDAEGSEGVPPEGERFAERFDLVVNALWGGRLAIDLTAGLTPPAGWTHRLRYCLFVRTATPLDLPSAIVVVGPFGDVKNYNDRDFYLSWYPVGLVAQGNDVLLAAPPPPVGEARERFIAGVRQGLGAALPWVGQILDAAESVTVAGGHVFAEGRGTIGELASDLHRRDRFGVTRVGDYVSVDTGKYSTTPWVARRLADDLLGG